MSQKLSLVIGVVVVVALAVYFGFFREYDVSQVPSPTPLPSSSCITRPPCLDTTPRCLPPEPAEGWCASQPESGWQTFTNIKYGYEIKYPPDWESDSSFDYTDVHINDGNPESDDYSLGIDGVTIEIWAGSKPADVGLYNFAESQKELGAGGLGAPSGKLTKTTFNGYPAVKAEHHGGEGQDGPAYFVEQTPTAYLYFFVYVGYNDPAETDQILSTFRFTE